MGIWRRTARRAALREYAYKPRNDRMYPGALQRHSVSGRVSAMRQVQPRKNHAPATRAKIILYR